MRRLLVWVPQHHGEAVRAAARSAGATRTVAVDARGDDDEALELVLVHLPNNRLEEAVDAMGQVAPLHASFEPRGIVALQPPPDEPPDEVVDVSWRSPLEVVIGAAQSIGSWSGFLGYAAVGGAVVWIALVTSTVYLLTAAMLIAPFAGPAMNAAIATARGDGHLLRRSMGRYAASIGTAIAVAALLTVVFGVDAPTELMHQVADVSAVAVLLPIAAGAAGALNLGQSDRTSLVSGAATGMLVAASLAPPAGLVGVGLVLGELGLVATSLWVLVVQLVGINLAGAVLFRVVHVRPDLSRYTDGRPRTMVASLAVSALLVAGLVALQLRLPVDLSRATLVQRAVEVVTEVVQRDPAARLLAVDVRAPRAAGAGRSPLLVQVWAAPEVATAGPAGGAADADHLTAAIGAALEARLPAALEPFVEVSLVGRAPAEDPVAVRPSGATHYHARGPSQPEQAAHQGVPGDSAGAVTWHG